MNMIVKLAELGNNDPEKGEYLLNDISKTLAIARKKHPKSEWKKMDVQGAFEALFEEAQEVKYAVECETDKRVREELLDVIAIALRMLNKEYS